MCISPRPSYQTCQHVSHTLSASFKAFYRFIVPFFQQLHSEILSQIKWEYFQLSSQKTKINYFHFQIEVVSGVSLLTVGVQRILSFDPGRGNLAQATLKTRTVIEHGAAQRQQTLTKDQNTSRIRSDKIQLNLITEAVV